MFKRGNQPQRHDGAAVGVKAGSWGQSNALEDPQFRLAYSRPQRCLRPYPDGRLGGMFEPEGDLANDRGGIFMRVAVSGATGFIGRRLLEQLTQPVVLTRDPARAVRRWAMWRPTPGTPSPPPPLEALRGLDAVFHLAGDPVAGGRWTEAKKRRIRDSRVLGTRNLVESLARLPEGERPKVLVSGSAVGYYGDRGDERLTEDAAPGSDFLANVCQAWEHESQAAQRLGIRVVNSRTGIVLGRGGGALGKMLLPFRLGLGGRLGSGRQWMPWIHLDDTVGLLLHASARNEVMGAMNNTAPNPVINREFTATLAEVLHRPALLPVPEFGLKLATGEFAEVLLASQRTVPAVAERTGYVFKYPDLRTALGSILSHS